MNESISENYVILTAREGSLTKAADKIGISQPALSSGISALEKKLGFRIFNRKCYPVRLTAEGSIYYDYLLKKRALSADFETRIQASLSDSRKHVSIGAPVAYTESLVADAVFRLLSANPDYRVSIRTASLSQLIEMSENGEIDCFISTTDDLPIEFEKAVIKQETVYLCVPKSLPAYERLCQKEDAQIPEDLAPLLDEKFIWLESDQPIQRLIDAFLKKQAIRLESSVTVDQVSTAVRLAALGLGCCFASEDSLCDEALREKLGIFPMTAAISGRTLYAVTHRDFYHSQACTALLAVLTEANRN